MKTKQFIRVNSGNFAWILSWVSVSWIPFHLRYLLWIGITPGSIKVLSENYTSFKLFTANLHNDAGLEEIKLMFSFLHVHPKLGTFLLAFIFMKSGSQPFPTCLAVPAVDFVHQCRFVKQFYIIDVEETYRCKVVTTVWINIPAHYSLLSVLS